MTADRGGGRSCALIISCKSCCSLATEGAQSVRTALGRIRWLPQGEEAEWPRFTALVNTPLQGGAADALKQAMVDLADKLTSSASIVSTVHDELIVECTSDNAEEVKALVEMAMLVVSVKQSVTY